MKPPEPPIHPAGLLRGMQTTDLLLHRLIAAPGVLCGVDLRTRQEYARVTPVDLDAFHTAHCWGPTLPGEPPELDVELDTGEQRRVRAHMRACLLPIGDDGMCTHIALSFRTGDAMMPSEGIIAAVQALARAGIECVLERSVMIGTWVIWIVFARPVPLGQAASLAQRVKEILRMIGIVDSSYVMPLLAEARHPLHLPLMFYSGRHFGVLYNVDDRGKLRPVPYSLVGVRAADAVPRSSAPSVETRACDELLPALRRWSEVHAAKHFRAGEFLQFAMEYDLLPESLLGLQQQPASIAVGRLLLASADGPPSDLFVGAKKSGNSFLFSVRSARTEEGLS